MDPASTDRWTGAARLGSLLPARVAAPGSGRCSRSALLQRRHSGVEAHIGSTDPTPGGRLLGCRGVRRADGRRGGAGRLRGCRGCGRRRGRRGRCDRGCSGLGRGCCGLGRGRVLGSGGGGRAGGVRRRRRDDGIPLAEVDPRGLALLADGLEVLGAADVEQPGDDVARHRLDPGVQVTHGGVVVAAGRRDAVLGLGQLVLQGHEVLVGLEVRVGLDDREQPAEGLAEHVLALGLLGGRLPRRHRGRAGLDDVLEGAALVGGVPLDRLDQVADQVVPAGQLDVDLSPGLLHQVAQLDQAVVGDDRPADDGDQEDDDDDDGDDHGCSRARTGGLTRS